MPAEIAGHFFQADKMESIAFGRAHAASRERCIIVIMGTGTAVVLFDYGKVSHVGGNGIGGGTMQGLGKLLIEETDGAAAIQCMIAEVVGVVASLFSHTKDH